jgi:hypothetical protein
MMDAERKGKQNDDKGYAGNPRPGPAIAACIAIVRRVTPHGIV